MIMSNDRPQEHYSASPSGIPVSLVIEAVFLIYAFFIIIINPRPLDVDLYSVPRKLI